MIVIRGELLPPQRSLFSIPDSVAYFNCAYLSPLTKRVVELGEQGVRRKAAPWAIMSENFFTESETLRSRFASLINATSDAVCIVPSVSYGIATASRNISVECNREIVVLEEQFPSNYYAWRRVAQRSNANVRVVDRPENGDWTSAVMRSLTNRAAVCAVPNCHWVDGGILDLEVIGTECRARGIKLVLDLTQSLGALPFDVQVVRPAFAVAAMYKWMLGPYSLGLMYVDPEYHEGEAIEDNWIHRRGADKFSSLSVYTDERAEGARKFDVGERSNFALVPMAIGAIEQLLNWGVRNVGHTLGTFNDQLAGALADTGLQVFPRQYSAPHFLSFQLPEHAPEGLAGLLARDSVFVSVRGRSVRVTPHLYNNRADAQRLLNSLEHRLSSGCAQLGADGKDGIEV